MPKGKNAEKKRFATHVTALNGKRVYISARSQAELDQKVAQAKLEMGAGVDIADDTTFEEFARLWLRTYKAPPKVRQSTYDVHNWHMEHNVIPYFEGARIRDIKPMHIQGFLASVSDYSHSVQNRCFQMVRGVFAAAEDNGLILKSPVRSRDKAGGDRAKEKDALTNAQATALLNAVEGTPAHLFCLAVLSTGMRRGEVLGLMWQDINFKTGKIRVSHNLTIPTNARNAEVTTLLKSDAAHRDLPMPLPLQKALSEEKRKSKSLYVFSNATGGHYQRKDYEVMWKEVTMRTTTENFKVGDRRQNRKGGKPYIVSLDFHCHPHLLRHTFITQCFESGMDIKQVQYLAGHSSPDMTLGVYTHYRQKERAQETAEKVHSATAYLSEKIGQDREHCTG